MHRFVITVTALLAMIFCQSAMADLNQKSSIDDVLDALQASGNNLKSFTADLTREESDAIGKDLTRYGKIWFQIKPDGNPIMHLLLNRKKVGDGKVVEDKKEYLLDDGWVIDRAYDIKVETRRQIAPPGQKVDLFQLGKGPLPLPIGQDKKAVYKQFEVSRVATDNSDPPDTIHLLLKPKPGSPLADKFTAIDVWVDLKSKMPVRIQTLDQPGNQNTNDLQNLQINPDLKPEDLMLPPLLPGWNSNQIPLMKKH
jgi:outer membrane lipoprotein-sorting protein